MTERRLQVTSRLGLHARAAANLVRVASRFQSSLTLQRLDGNAEADAKSILSILTLAASRGTDLKIIANGIDEQEALDAVVGLFTRDFDELEKSVLMRETLGDHIFDHFLAAKREEWDSYIRHVSPWEIERYLNTY